MKGGSGSVMVQDLLSYFTFNSFLVFDYFCIACTIVYLCSKTSEDVSSKNTKFMKTIFKLVFHDLENSLCPCNSTIQI